VLFGFEHDHFATAHRERARNGEAHDAASYDCTVDLFLHDRYSRAARVQKRKILSGMDWDPGFINRSPMLTALAEHARALSQCARWPTREALQDLLTAKGVANERGLPLRLVAPDDWNNLSYESRIYQRGELELREREWHDFFNVLAWLTYPCTKAALNERHVAATLAESATAVASAGKNRGRVRDALTLLDESGAIVVSTDAQVLEDLHAFRWKRLFWQRRREFIAHARVYVFGHGLCEKALTPYVGLTAHALTIPTDNALDTATIGRELQIVDALAAGRIRDGGLLTPQSLAPLPLLGVPGWWTENEREDFYDNGAYFRPGRVQLQFTGRDRT
jgi:hypothetical protein